MKNRHRVKQGLTLGEVLVCASHDHPGVSLRAIKRKARRIFLCLVYRRQINELIERIRKQNIAIQAIHPPRILQLVERPYINNKWPVGKRLDVIATHYELLNNIDTNLSVIGCADSVQLADLGHICPQLTVTIDHARWLLCEGELVLNLFMGDLRVVSLAFSIGGDVLGTTCIYVGALQGIHRGIPHEQSLAIYRDLTKQLNGLRPKPLIVDVLRMMATQLGANRILAVADDNRQHRHPYFGKRERRSLASNYDEIWQELGGRLDSESGFYDIPLQYSDRDLSEIPSKKRAMYRRRYEMLDFINSCVTQALRKQP